MANERIPIGVIMIERHGRVKVDKKYPETRKGQGRYELTDEAKSEARKIGDKTFDYLEEQGLVKLMQKHGVYIHAAPSDYVRAGQTGSSTSSAFFDKLLENEVEVRHSKEHLRPKPSMRFLEVPDIAQYPPSDSETQRLWENVEERLAKGEKIPGWEHNKTTEKRTATAAKLRRLLLREFNTSA